MPENCIFCKIIEGNIPSSKVYEDDKVLAFLDIGPVNKGHTLVIPKLHCETLFDVPDELLQYLITKVKKIANAVMKAADAGGLNIGVSNYPTAGQVVPHAHFHLMPRHAGDGLRHWPQGRYAEGEMEEFRKKIIDEL